MYKFYYQTPIGRICIREDDNFIVGLDLDNEDNSDGVIEKETNLIKETYQQLSEYFNKDRKEFSIPIKIQGSEFQEKVWKELINIPYGQTKTYGQIASIICKHNASRAVGSACHKNRIIILIPCHRVIGSNGALVGFGCGLDVKSYLLDLERQN